MFTLRAGSLLSITHGLDAESVLSVVHGRQGHATMAALLRDRPSEVNHAENRELLALETADLDGVVPIAGAAAFLAALDSGALPNALVTSADVGLATARMGAARLPMPRVQVTAESVSASKPAPEGFALP